MNMQNFFKELNCAQTCASSIIIYPIISSGNKSTSQTRECSVFDEITISGAMVRIRLIQAEPMIQD